MFLKLPPPPRLLWFFKIKNVKILTIFFTKNLIILRWNKQISLAKEGSFLLLSFQKKIYFITNLSHFSVVNFIVSYTGTHLRLRSRGFNFVQSAKASSAIRD